MATNKPNSLGAVGAVGCCGGPVGDPGPEVCRDFLFGSMEMQRVNPRQAIKAGWSEIQVRMFRPFAYLATPYSHKDKLKQVERYLQVTKAAAWLLNETGWNVLSPITHSHPIHVLGENVRGDWEYWKRIDTEFLQHSFAMVVFVVPGWKESTGVTCERQIAKDEGLIEYYLHKMGRNDYRLTKSEERPQITWKEETDL